MPKISSNMTTKRAKYKAYFSRKGRLKTEAEKYSSILNENPFTSIAFTSPEIMNIVEMRILKIVFIDNF